MLSTDRADFEAQLGVLFGGYPTFITPPRVEAYWRGLQKMPLSVFVRCVDHALGESGTDKLPTVNSLWQISRHLRAVSSVPQRQAAAPAMNPLQRAASGAILSMLNSKGPASDAALVKIIALKNRIVSQAPVDADDDELRDVVMGAIEKLWEPMSAECIQAHVSRRFGGSA